MPSTPKIKREDILDAAFSLLLEEGYSAINITALAQRMGCSTQPISWQFGGMEGLRQELFAYCQTFLQDRYVVCGDTADEAMDSVAAGYVTLAFDIPNLYRHLYMTDRNGKEMDRAVLTHRRQTYDTVVGWIVRDHGLSEKAARKYMSDFEMYVHGIASYAAIGFLTDSKQEVLQRVSEVRMALLAAAKKEEVSL